MLGNYKLETFCYGGKLHLSKLTNQIPITNPKICCSLVWHNTKLASDYEVGCSSCPRQVKSLQQLPNGQP
jgi:hypothetical protein